MPSKNQLPPKESSLFKRILKCYEHKQYKNGLKFAKQILSNPKFALHGETLAMKGLTLNCLGRKEEAYEYVRKGLRNDLTSHVCWHVYGLLQRSYKKYDEAIKCYRNALKYEKENIQILRDLSLVQIQTRDLEGFRETKFQLFKLRPGLRVSWIEFAVACHLLEDYDFALEILNEFIEKNQSPNNSESEYENSELLLYKNMILQEAGYMEKALEHLQENKNKIFDKISLLEMIGELYLKKSNFDEAKTIFEDLLDRNHENLVYYHKLIEANQLTEPNLIVDLLEECVYKYPNSIPPRLLILKYTSHEKFECLINAYLQKNLCKGVPPLFKQLRFLYSDRWKVNVIEELLLNYAFNLSKYGQFSCDDYINKQKEPVTVILWTYFYLAQHFDYLNNTEKALYFIDLAIDHTPTLIELLMLKGRIYKHAGNVLEASKWLDEAQLLDTADRYINSKCAKYLLRANNIKYAEEICAKFTREGAMPMDSLNEMQCMWFQIECALAYKRLGKLGEALKKCHEIDRHFSEIIEDQFDFHTYCMRKITLKAYIKFLRLEDVLRSHDFYFKAAKCAIEIYLYLYDQPFENEGNEIFKSSDDLAPSDLKKLLNKQRKARKKAERKNAEVAQALVKKEQYNKSRQQETETDTPQLDELIPEKLLRVHDPLEAAIRFLKPLQNLLPKCIETHLMAFEIYFRKKKIMLMLQAIKKGFEIDRTNDKLHSCIIRFYCFLQENIESKLDILQKVIQEETEQIFQSMTARQLNEQYLKDFPHSLSKVLEGAKMMYYLESRNKKKALNLLLNFDNDWTDFNLKNCEAVYKSLKHGVFGQCDQEVIKFREYCHKRFPLADCFASNTMTFNDHGNFCNSYNNHNGLFPYSGQSHFAFFEPLLDSLHARGHNLTVISYFPKKHKLDNYRDISLTDFSEIFLNIYEFKQLEQTRTRRYYGVKLLFEMGIESCNALKIEKMTNFLKERNEFDVIIAELFNSECFYGFAHYYNAPVISLSTCNIFSWLNPYFGNPDNPAYVPNIFLDHTDKMTFISRLENTLLSIFQKLLYIFYFLPAQNLIARDYFGPNLPDLQEIIRNYSTILLTNTHFITNLPRPLMPNIIEVAGLHLKQSSALTNELQEFINSATAGVVLVSMGSMINGSTLPDDKKRVFINVFKKMPQKFIWKWETEEMLDKSDNVLLTKWIPQLDVLRQSNVKGFISHGGLLSSIELVQCAVPAVLVPQFADQFSNAAALQDRGLALILRFPEIDEVKLMDALQTILSEKYQKRAKDVSKIFQSRSASALNTSVQWVEYIAKYQELNEIKSFAANLNFYQYNSLDIYAFIILIVSIFFLITFYIIRKFSRTYFSKLKLE